MSLLQPVYDSIRNVLKDSILQDRLERMAYPKLFEEKVEVDDLLTRERKESGIKNIDLTPEQLNILHRNFPADRALIQRHIYRKNGGPPIPIPVVEKGKMVGIRYESDKELYRRMRKQDGRTFSEKVLGKLFYDN
jgi:hypothetical protein